jgi:hypothetical protein
VARAQGEQPEKASPFILAPAEFAATAMKRFEAFARAQAEQLQETNRQCLDRVQAEANLASELVSKLTVARSIPDAMTAYREWGGRRLEMVAEDTKHLLDDTHKFIQMSAQLLANGWQSKGPNVSS